MGQLKPYKPMPINANYLKRKYVHVEFETLPSYYSVIIIRNQKLVDNSKSKYQERNGEPISYNKISRLKLNDFMISIGTVFGNLSGISNGYIYYNSPEDINKGCKYSLYFIEEADGSCRIDFLELPEEHSNKDIMEQQNITPDKTKAFLDSQLAFQYLDHHPLQKENKYVQQKMKWTEANHTELVKSIQHRKTDVFDEYYQVPKIVFKGSKVPLITDRESSFIGVVEFL
ncbi:hypothetical protein ACO0R3_002150 [Hanseniaspora guilliermondii]